MLTDVKEAIPRKDAIEARTERQLPHVDTDPFMISRCSQQNDIMFGDAWLWAGATRGPTRGRTGIARDRCRFVVLTAEARSPRPDAGNRRPAL